MTRKSIAFVFCLYLCEQQYTIAQAIVESQETYLCRPNHLGYPTIYFHHNAINPFNMLSWGFLLLNNLFDGFTTARRGMRRREGFSREWYSCRTNGHGVRGTGTGWGQKGRALYFTLTKRCCKVMSISQGRVIWSWPNWSEVGLFVSLNRLSLNHNEHDFGALVKSMPY